MTETLFQNTQLYWRNWKRTFGIPRHYCPQEANHSSIGEKLRPTPECGERELRLQIDNDSESKLGEDE